MHNLLFEHQTRLSESFYSKAAAQLGLAVLAFDACIADEGARAVESDIEMATKLKILSTPMFFIGLVTDTGDVRVTSVMHGSQGIDMFRKSLDSVLEAQIPAR